MTYFGKIITSAIIRRLVIWLAVLAAHRGWINALTGQQIDSTVAWTLSIGMILWSVIEKVKAHGLDWKQLGAAILRGGMDGGGAFLATAGIADLNTLHTLGGLLAVGGSAVWSALHKTSVTDMAGALLPKDGFTTQPPANTAQPPQGSVQPVPTVIAGGGVGIGSTDVTADKH